MSAYPYSEPPAYDETKYDDEPRLPSYEESCEQERLDAQRCALESERAQLILAVRELDRIRMEMEERIRAEMEERVRQEMEERIRKEMEERVRKEMEEREQTRLRQIEEEKEAKEAKQREEEDPQEIKKHNAKMVDVFMRYLEQALKGTYSGFNMYGIPFDDIPLRKLLTSLLAPLDSRALHLTSNVHCQLSNKWYMGIHVYLITTTSVFHTYLYHGGLSGEWKRGKNVGELYLLYTFREPLVVGSMEETMLSKVCARHCGRIYQAPSMGNTGIDKTVGEGSIPLLQDIVHSITGTHSKDPSFL